MNLENLGLVELNAREVQEVDGGWLRILDGIKYALLLLEAAHNNCNGHSGSYINQGGVTVAAYRVH